MWKYYNESNVCYVYLEDVPDVESGLGPKFGQSKWFTRGWTLQELIASTSLELYTHDWKAIGTKLERYQELAEITSIDEQALTGMIEIGKFNAAQRLSWASHRRVTVTADHGCRL